eukprot:TRINITY_DN975_c0_g1_i1.p1 TRINITY_DN975_c0_g1~~TRINITY_DN975_c0_g1_i1.p1  ORF type:complete len:1426 (-),score=199.23 TRINITY_DN975_c0_g1_i1:11083-15360(-)
MQSCANAQRLIIRGLLISNNSIHLYTNQMEARNKKYFSKTLLYTSAVAKRQTPKGPNLTTRGYSTVSLSKGCDGELNNSQPKNNAFQCVSHFVSADIARIEGRLAEIRKIVKEPDTTGGLMKRKERFFTTATGNNKEKRVMDQITEMEKSIISVKANMKKQDALLQASLESFKILQDKKDSLSPIVTKRIEELKDRNNELLNNLHSVTDHSSDWSESISCSGNESDSSHSCASEPIIKVQPFLIDSPKPSLPEVEYMLKVKNVVQGFISSMNDLQKSVLNKDGEVYRKKKVFEQYRGELSKLVVDTQQMLQNPGRNTVNRIKELSTTESCKSLKSEPNKDLDKTLLSNCKNTISFLKAKDLLLKLHSKFQSEADQIKDKFQKELNDKVILLEGYRKLWTTQFRIFLSKNQELREAYEELKDEVENLKAVLNEKNNQFIEMREKLNGKDKEYKIMAENYELQLQERTMQMVEKEKVHAEKIETLRGQLKNENNELSEQRKEVQRLKATIDGLRQTISQFEQSNYKEKTLALDKTKKELSAALEANFLAEAKHINEIQLKIHEITEKDAQIQEFRKYLLSQDMKLHALLRNAKNLFMTGVGTLTKRCENVLEKVKSGELEARLQHCAKALGLLRLLTAHQVREKLELKHEVVRKEERILGLLNEKEKLEEECSKYKVSFEEMKSALKDKTFELRKMIDKKKALEEFSATATEMMKRKCEMLEVSAEKMQERLNQAKENIRTKIYEEKVIYKEKAQIIFETIRNYIHKFVAESKGKIEASLDKAMNVIKVLKTFKEKHEEVSIKRKQAYENEVKSLKETIDAKIKIIKDLEDRCSRKISRETLQELFDRNFIKFNEGGTQTRLKLMEARIEKLTKNIEIIRERYLDNKAKAKGELCNFVVQNKVLRNRIGSLTAKHSRTIKALLEAGLESVYGKVLQVIERFEERLRQVQVIHQEHIKKHVLKIESFKNDLNEKSERLAETEERLKSTISKEALKIILERHSSTFSKALITVSSGSQTLASHADKMNIAIQKLAEFKWKYQQYKEIETKLITKSTELSLKLYEKIKTSADILTHTHFTKIEKKVQDKTKALAMLEKKVTEMSVMKCELHKEITKLQQDNTRKDEVILKLERKCAKTIDKVKVEYVLGQFYSMMKTSISVICNKCGTMGNCINKMKELIHEKLYPKVTSKNVQILGTIERISAEKLKANERYNHLLIKSRELFQTFAISSQAYSYGKFSELTTRIQSIVPSLDKLVGKVQHSSYLRTTIAPLSIPFPVLKTKALEQQKALELKIAKHAGTMNTKMLILKSQLTSLATKIHSAEYYMNLAITTCKQKMQQGTKHNKPIRTFTHQLKFNTEDLIGKVDGIGKKVEQVQRLFTICKEICGSRRAEHENIIGKLKEKVKACVEQAPFGYAFNLYHKEQNIRRV